jgi:hypothetical protein
VGFGTAESQQACHRCNHFAFHFIDGFSFGIPPSPNSNTTTAKIALYPLIFKGMIVIK